MNRKKQKIKFRSNYVNKKVNYSWIIGITMVTFMLAILFGYISLVFMEKVNLILATVILFIIIMIGIFFDALGIAVTAAVETPFHSMAANKVPAAKESIMLIRNAGMVANFFNDVIGDISSIISGAAATAIVVKINEHISVQSTILSILLSAVVAALTVGGKAAGKEFALRRSNYIVYKIGTILSFFTKIKANFQNKQS